MTPASQQTLCEERARSAIGRTERRHAHADSLLAGICSMALMRPMAFAAALVFLVAVCAPIAAAASDDPMPCCKGEGAAMCCPFDGAGVWKACPGSQHEAPPAGLTAFALPVTEDLAAPSPGPRAWSVGEKGGDCRGLSLPDPPPRA